MDRRKNKKKDKEENTSKKPESWKNLRKTPHKLKKAFRNLIAQGDELRGNSSKDIVVHAKDPMIIEEQAVHTPHPDDAIDEYIESTFPAAEHQEGHHETDQGEDVGDEGDGDEGDGDGGQETEHDGDDDDDDDDEGDDADEGHGGQETDQGEGEKRNNIY